MKKTEKLSRNELTTEGDSEYVTPIKKKIVIGTLKVEVLEIDHAKREIRMLIHTHFSPADLKSNTQARTAVEQQRDSACRYLATEGYLEKKKPCVQNLSSREWCIRAGVIHDLTP